MIEVRLLSSDDARVLDAVAPDVFDHPVDPRWVDEFFGDERHHLAVALDDQQVVGMASAVHYVHPDKAPSLWINEVGVAPAYRRQGIATRLLRCLMNRGRALRCTEAWLLTEPDNDEARALYDATGGTLEPTVSFTWTL